MKLNGLGRLLQALEETMEGKEKVLAKLLWTERWSISLLSAKPKSVLDTLNTK